MTIDLAKAVFDERGSDGRVSLLSTGMSSCAWVAMIDGREWVVRTPAAGDARRDPDYRREELLNAALREAGVPATDVEALEVDGIGCAIAPRVVGEPVRHDSWTDAFVSDVADALAATHSLSPVNHDLPAAVERFHLARIWPLDGSALDEHPVTTRLPHLVEAVRRRENAIRLEAHRNACVVHTDLHRDHLLVSSAGRLAGILDFGDAFAGPPAWDFACLRYYHGDDIARRVAAHYPDGDVVRDRSESIGIAFALYKLDKTPERPDVLERVERLIRAA